MHLGNISLSVRKKNQQQIFAKYINKSQKHPNTKPLPPQESIANESHDLYSYDIGLLCICSSLRRGVIQGGYNLTWVYVTKILTIHVRRPAVGGAGGGEVIRGGSAQKASGI